jgi:hypothetical protein
LRLFDGIKRLFANGGLLPIASYGGKVMLRATHLFPSVLLLDLAGVFRTLTRRVGQFMASLHGWGFSNNLVKQSPDRQPRADESEIAIS